jgi:hypothetical protein
MSSVYADGMVAGEERSKYEKTKKRDQKVIPQI